MQKRSLSHLLTA